MPHNFHTSFSWPFPTVYVFEYIRALSRIIYFSVNRITINFLLCTTEKQATIRSEFKSDSIAL